MSVTLVGTLTPINSDNCLFVFQPTQPSLAYLTAATHGLQEDAEQIQEQLLTAEKKLPELNPDAKFIRPPVPILQAESNWPLLTVTKVIAW